MECVPEYIFFVKNQAQVHTQRKAKETNEEKWKTKETKEVRKKVLLLWKVSVENLTNYVSKICMYDGFPQANLLIQIDVSFLPNKNGRRTLFFNKEKYC